MNCEKTLELIDDYCDGGLSEQQNRTVTDHIEGCNNCGQMVVARRTLVKSLGRMSAGQPPARLAERILLARKHVDRETAKQKAIWFSAGIGSSIAAGIVLFVAINILQPSSLSSPELSYVLAPAQQAQNINFLFQSKHQLDNVRFSVIVPPKLDLDGFKGQRELAWKGIIKPGQNLLSIPVIASEAISGVLVVRIEHKNSTKEFRLHIDVESSRKLSAIGFDKLWFTELWFTEHGFTKLRLAKKLA